MSKTRSLTEAEKEHIYNTLEQACGGTPLQSNAEFAGQYLGNVVISMIENWETIQRTLKQEDPNAPRLNCGHPRDNAEQRFCHTCGAEHHEVP